MGSCVVAYHIVRVIFTKPVPKCHLTQTHHSPLQSGIFKHDNGGLLAGTPEPKGANELRVAGTTSTGCTAAKIIDGRAVWRRHRSSMGGLSCGIEQAKHVEHTSACVPVPPKPLSQVSSNPNSSAPLQSGIFQHGSWSCLQAMGAQNIHGRAMQPATA